MTTLVDVKAGLISDVGETAIKRVQEIPDDFLKSLRADRDASSAPAGEFHRICSVPVAVVEAWERSGFVLSEMTGRAILAKLRAEHLDAFITTNKTL